MSKRRKKVKKKNRKIVWIIESLLFIILISLLVLLKIFNPQELSLIHISFSPAGCFQNRSVLRISIIPLQAKRIRQKCFWIIPSF